MNRRTIASILLAFVVTRAALVLAGTLIVATVPGSVGEQYTHLLDGGPALDMFYRWDAGFYTSIATFGYDWYNERRAAEDLAFLPLYPLLVRAASELLGFDPSAGCVVSPYLSTCTTLGGVIVSNLALLASAFVLYDLARRAQPRLFTPTSRELIAPLHQPDVSGNRAEDAVNPLAMRAVLLLLLAPNSIYLSGVYTESLFLLLCLLTFWLLERGRFGWALLPATAAALTRSVGVALYPALLWNALNRPHPLPSSLSGRGGKAIRLLLAHIPVLAFASYVLFGGLTAGEPLAYFSTYDVIWQRPAGSPIEAFTIYFSGAPVALFGWHPAWIDLAATLVYLALALLTLRWRRDWGLFALFALLIPIAAGSLLAMPRFGAVIFPFYILIASWLDTRPKQIAAYALSAALALFILARFVTWGWIA